MSHKKLDGLFKQSQTVIKQALTNGVRVYFLIGNWICVERWRELDMLRYSQVGPPLSQSDIMPVLLHSYKWITPCLLHPRFFHLLVFNSYSPITFYNLSRCHVVLQLCICWYVPIDMSLMRYPLAHVFAPDSPSADVLHPVPSFSAHPSREQASGRGNDLDIAELGVPSQIKGTLPPHPFITEQHRLPGLTRARPFYLSNLYPIPI